MNTTDKLAACQKVMDLVDVYAACQTKDTRYEVRAALLETVDVALAAAPAAPAGWVLMPVEPTPEMVEAGNAAAHAGGCDLWQLKREVMNAWPAMLAAAPAAPAQEAVMLVNGMTPLQFALNELSEFQQATGCDTADEYKAEQEAKPAPDYDAEYNLVVAQRDWAFKQLGAKPAPAVEPVPLESIYETIIHWDEGGGKRSRRELARRIALLLCPEPAAPAPTVKESLTTAPAVEPVAELSRHLVTVLCCASDCLRQQHGRDVQLQIAAECEGAIAKVKALTAPAAPAPEPLTDEQIIKLLRPQVWAHVEGQHRRQMLEDARAIEQAHGIGIAASKESGK